MVRSSRIKQLLAVVVLILFPLLMSAPSIHASPRYPLSPLQIFAEGEAACASPPANFDPTRATNSELRYFGLPLPPEDKASYSHWVDMLRHAHKRVCGGPEVVGSRYVGPTNVHLPSQRSSNGIHSHNSADNSSANWAGFVATNGGFDETFADWTVPCYDSNSPYNATAVQWVGIGGYGTNNLWQAGTETDRGKGYKFWWENYPVQPQVYYGPSVGCGNHVAVQVDYQLTCGSGQSYFDMANYSNNQYQPKCVSFTPNTNSAEWIDERTGTFNQHCYWALAKFGHTDWSYAQARSTKVAGNSLQPISSFSSVELDMYNNPSTYTDLLAASPYGLNSDGKSFTDDWYDYGTATC